MCLSEFEAGRIKSNMPIYAQQKKKKKKKKKKKIKKKKKRNKQTNIKKKTFCFCSYTKH
jgi:hypothetical protein